MPKKVLVVDDDPNTVRFLSVALEENGYEAVGAADGKEGFEKAVAEKPDLILLDVMMPKRTGFTMLKQMKKTEGMENVPVIMLTGVTASLEAQDDKSDDTFEQPFARLRDSLRKTIDEMKQDGVDSPDFFIEKPIEDVFFLIVGAPRCGKTTFGAALHHALGAGIVARPHMQSFLQKQNRDAHQARSDLHRLRGKRFAIASNTTVDSTQYDVTNMHFTRKHCAT